MSEHTVLYWNRATPEVYENLRRFVDGEPPT